MRNCYWIYTVSRARYEREVHHARSFTFKKNDFKSLIFFPSYSKIYYNDTNGKNFYGRRCLRKSRIKNFARAIT